MSMNEHEKGRSYPSDILARARRIKLLLLDVDGVLTDGRIIFGTDGLELKNFYSQDGVGLNLIREAGIATGVITARASEMVRRRMGELGFRHIVENAKDKLKAFEDILAQDGLSADQCAYMGDDWIDLPLFSRVGLALAPADAVLAVRNRAHFVPPRPGGRGAVREACALLLVAQGLYESTLARYLE